MIKTSAYAQFPYVESFRSSTATGIVFGGAPSAFLTAAGSSSNGGTPIDPIGSGWLRLTNNAQNQKGYAYSTSNFPSSNGLRVDFEYAIYGGSRADGISFFLFDATASPFTIGGFGGSLGYAQITTTNPISEGVSKGYLAIGLDEYGNFSNNNEGRQGGIGFRPGSVTLRGKGNGAATTPDNYRFLTSEHPDELGASLIGDGSQRISDPTNMAYRKVAIELIPNPAGGYNINVYITKGGSPQQRVKIIDNYYYPDAAPTSLRYGFASSTGDETNFHEIRNVAIDLYTTNPITLNDAANACRGITSSLDVTLNDKANESNTTLDKTSVDLNPSIAGVQSTFTVAGQGTFSVDVLGIVQFVPEPTFLGSSTASYTIKDSQGILSNVSTITFNYSAPPTTPNAGPNESINVFTPTGSYTLQGSASSIGTWSQVSGPNTAVFTNPALNTTTVTNLISGTYVFRWRVTTAGGCSEFDDVQLIVNHPPVAVNDVATTPLNTPVDIPIVNNDNDDTGNPSIPRASILIKTPPAHGSLTINYTTGVVTYDPVTGYTGSDSFTYTVKDVNNAESNIATVTIVVNKSLVGLDDIAATTTNTPVIVRVLDNDPKKIGASVLKVLDPSHGIIAVNLDGTVTYTPSPGYSGKDIFTYKLVDGNGEESDPITVNLTVKPAGVTDNANSVAGVTVIIPVKDNDPGKTGTTVVIPVTPPASGTISLNPAGNVVYVPAPGFSGKDVFTYKLKTIDDVESDPVTVNVTIKPIGSPDMVTTTPNQAVMLPIKDNDLSKTGTTIVLTSNPPNGTVTIIDGSVIYSPRTGFSGKDSFNYILRTADGVDSDPIPVDIIVKPIGSADNVTTPPNTPINISVIDNDLSKTGTTPAISSGPVNGTAVVNGKTVIYTPRPDYTGKDVFTYTLTTIDGIESDPITVNVTIRPVGSPDNVTTPLNTAITISIKDNDASKTGTTPSLVANPAHGTVTINANGQAVYVPVTGYSGTDVFTYKLTTADGVDSDPITVTVTISAIIPAPDFNVVIPANTPYTVDVPLAPGNSVTVTIPPKNGTVTFDPATGKPIYTPNAGYSGPDDFTYIIKDPGGNQSTPGKVTITVIKPAKVGLAKSLVANVRNANGSTTLSYVFTIVNLGDIAIERLTLTDDLALAFPGRTFTVNRLAANGTLRANSNFNGISIKEMLLLTSTLASNGRAQVELDITVAASTQSGTYSNSATAQGFSVSNGAVTTDVSTNGLVPDPITAGDVSPSVPTLAPILVAPNITVPVNTGQPVIIDITPPTGGTIVITKQPTNGRITFDPATGKPIYTPNPGYSGPDDFIYVIRDANGNESQPGTVTITVTKPAKIGLAKSLRSNVKNFDGTYNLIYRLTLKNYGDVAIERVSLTDNLALAFTGANYEIINVSAGSSNLRLNTSYNGNTVTNLLLATSTLPANSAANSTDYVDVEIRVTLLEEEGRYNNFAIAEGNSVSDGSQTSDQSTNGLLPDPNNDGDVTPSILTGVVLTQGSVKIPGGFSPNNDGINDFFVVENTLGKKISLEVFNRWGNRIYRATDYQNNWSGKTTEGVYVGDDVPSGTYYYIIMIDGTNKRVGFITINR
ncbi:Ig-like domain-containing protein [Pedobacter metabolipauper]|uniref:Ig-like domain-containing protein n=1 Tax=Pedobacter metabolipauper TaxID=425513 RepID=UPI001AAD7A4F|nr:Ig-like domain-containing protein [Pedobacter metabolipauper]